MPTNDTTPPSGAGIETENLSFRIKELKSLCQQMTDEIYLPKNENALLKNQNVEDDTKTIYETANVQRA